MEAYLTETMDRGQRVALAVAPFQAELDDYVPLQEAVTEAAALTTALAAKGATQDVDTTPTTTGKDAERAKMALTTQALSRRMG